MPSRISPSTQDAAPSSLSALSTQHAALSLHAAPRSAKPFSIITAAYQAGSKLDATIKTVLREDPELYEYIIVDGGSTDSTIEVLKKHGDRVRWISEPDRGVYDAMNKGIARSEGRYLYFLGAGDVLYPGVLPAIAQSFPITIAESCTVTSQYPMMTPGITGMSASTGSALSMTFAINRRSTGARFLRCSGTPILGTLFALII